MKKFSLNALIIVLVCSFFLTGCTSEENNAVIGEWYLIGLEDYYTGEEYEFDSEVFAFGGDGTGKYIYLPGDYYEELSYITWKFDLSSSDVITVKHSEDYIYDLDLINVSDEYMQCAYYFENDPDTYYLATYERMPEDSFEYVGSWSYYEYYEGDEYYDTESYYLYLYPDGTMMDIYYEGEEQLGDYGTWEYTGKYLALTFDGYDTVRYDVSIQSNSLELYGTSEQGNKITYVYKRYYGLITNDPPATYPQNALEAFSDFIASVFKRLAGNFVK
jgi:hypothetical protein